MRSSKWERPSRCALLTGAVQGSRAIVVRPVLPVGLVRAISPRFAMMRGMTRFAVLVVCVFAACSKSAGSQDKVSSPPPATGDTIAVPKGPAPTMGAAPTPSLPPSAPAADDDRMKLKPEEGTLAVVVPPDAKAGVETVARITVVPAKGYHVNTEYPTKLQIT